MIQARNLTKRYGDTTAVDDLTFTVRPGIVTGFLGPNGAGKSTTMRMIVGLDAPTSGSVTVNGKAYRDLAAPLHELGALLEARGIHTGRSATNHLRALAATTGIGRRRVDEVIDLVGLREVAKKRVGAFSLGMGQRLGIATALLGDPATVMLDEPINGLDPEGIRWVRDLLNGLAAEGRTVFVSSHLMSEMAQTARHLIVVGRGRLISDVSTQEFIARASTSAVKVRTLQPQELAHPGRRARRRGQSVRRVGRTHRDRAEQRRDRDPRCRGPTDPARALTRAGISGGSVHGADPGLGPVPLHRSRGCGMTITSPDHRRPDSEAAWGHGLRPASHPGRRGQIRVDQVLDAAVELADPGRRRPGPGHPRRGHRLQHGPPLRRSGPRGLRRLGSTAGLLPGAAADRGSSGVLFVTGEYSTGMSARRSPPSRRRLPVLIAKPWSSGSSPCWRWCPAPSPPSSSRRRSSSHYGHGSSLSDPGVLRAVIGTGVYLALVGLLGGALGWIVRSTPGALVSVRRACCWWSR